MFAGKTDELVRRVRRALAAKRSVLVVKHAADKRYGPQVTTHDLVQLSAVTADNSRQVVEAWRQSGTSVLAIDEAQFFDDGLADACNGLVREGAEVIVAGLDLDYLGRPFGPIPRLLALADTVTKLNAICTVCGAPASRTQRLLADSKLVLPGGAQEYEPRCRDHFAPETF